MTRIHAVSSQGTTEVMIRIFPDTCPFCHFGIKPDFVNAVKDQYNLYLGFYCTRNECGNFFLGRYVEYAEWNLMNTVLGRPKKQQFPIIIQDISPAFIDIYAQAQVAEQENLDEVCGMGYRKALEFLIKDYIISQNEDLRTVVGDKLLGACIRDHIESSNIKNIASRAAWLGNDETHYIRKWIQMDVKNLKQLINLTTHWIETEHLTKQMIEDMPAPENNKNKK